MIRVNNQEYQKAKKAGFDGSYAAFAEYCNNLNSEHIRKDKLITPGTYFNDVGTTSASPAGTIPAATLDGGTQTELAVLDIVKEKVAQGASTTAAPPPSTIMGLNPFAFVLILVFCMLVGIHFFTGEPETN